MLRRFTLSALASAAMAFGVVAAGAAGPPPDTEPPTGKAGKGKLAKAEKWAMKLAKADPETAARWEAMRLEKERDREEAVARKERERDEALLRKEQERAAKLAKKNGTVEPPPAAEEKPDPRPTVQRYGNLPKEVPKWWADVDADKDVQLSLYEWRTATRKVDEFVTLDLNTDGLLTVEEYLRATAPDEPRKK